MQDINILNLKYCCKNYNLNLSSEKKSKLIIFRLANEIK